MKKTSYLLAHMLITVGDVQKRMEAFESKARQHLMSSPAIGSWVTPSAGMFLWIKLRLPPSSAEAKDEGDSFGLISDKAKAAGVLALPGVAFMPPPSASGAGLPAGTKKTSCYVRTSFSQVPLDQVDLAFERLRGVVVNAWKEAGLTLADE